jgi:hypothetical protein
VSLSSSPLLRALLWRDILLLRDDFPLNGLFVVGSATGRTKPIYVVFDIVEAELADLVVNAKLASVAPLL